MNVIKPLSALLVAAMLITVTVVSIPTEDTMEDVTLIDSPYYDADLYRVLFEYSSGGDLDYQDECYYTDEYFFSPSTEYDQSLATASLCLSMSAFLSFVGPVPYGEAYYNVRDLLKNTGFSDFEVNDDFKREPTVDSIGLAMANKQINDHGEEYTLVALAIRGSGYGAEWVENFQMGTGENSEGHHEGFYNAMNRTLEFVDSYMIDKGISGDIKFWITGYSRAAAVSNMVAGNIDTSIALGEPVLGGNVSLLKEDLYAYTFGTPMGVYYDENSPHPDPRCDYYNNIWNIFNKNDFISKMAMDAIGFCRYGNDVTVHNTDDDGYESQRDLMLEFYMGSDSIANLEPYVIDDFVPYMFDFMALFDGKNPLIVDQFRIDRTQGEVLDSMMDNLTDAIGGRAGYVNKIETNLCELLGGLYEYGNDYHIAMFLRFMALYVMDSGEDGGEALYITLAKDLLLGSRYDLADDLYDPVKASLFICGLITEEDLLHEKAIVFSRAMASLAFTLKDDILTDGDCINDVISMVLNFNTIMVAHYPESTLAWLKSGDKNYLMSYE